MLIREWNSVATRSRAEAEYFEPRWKSDVSAFPALDHQIEFGPAFTYEYSTRDTYGTNITGWGPNDPLNATWWHRVTEGTFHADMKYYWLILVNLSVMENNTDLVRVRLPLFGSDAGSLSPSTHSDIPHTPGQELGAHSSVF